MLVRAWSSSSIIQFGCCLGLSLYVSMHAGDCQGICISLLALNALRLLAVKHLSLKIYLDMWFTWYVLSSQNSMLKSITSNVTAMAASLEMHCREKMSQFGMCLHLLQNECDAFLNPCLHSAVRDDALFHVGNYVTCSAVSLVIYLTSFAEYTLSTYRA